jgi:hypothetical protein
MSRRYQPMSAREREHIRAVRAYRKALRGMRKRLNWRGCKEITHCSIVALDAFETRKMNRLNCARRRLRIAELRLWRITGA